MGRAGPQNTSNSDVSRLAFFEYLRKSCEGREERKGCGEWWTVAAGPLTALLLSTGSWFRTFFPRPHSFLSEPTAQRYPDGEASLGSYSIPGPASCGLSSHPHPKFQMMSSLVELSKVKQFTAIARPTETGI